MGFERPGRYEQLFEQFFEPFGAQGAAVAKAIALISEAQHHALLEQGLAAYFAGRDALMDAGELLGTVAQPKRARLSALSMAPEAELAAFEMNVITPMHVFAGALQTAFDSLPASDDRFIAEVRDGAEIDLVRARFAEALWSVPVLKARGRDVSARLSEVDALFARAQAIVTRRRAGLHDSQSRRLLLSGENQTLYPYGYLFETNALCFWQRERILVRAAALGVSEMVPACVDVDP